MHLVNIQLELNNKCDHLQKVPVQKFLNKYCSSKYFISVSFSKIFTSNTMFKRENFNESLVIINFMPRNTDRSVKFLSNPH